MKKDVTICFRTNEDLKLLLENIAEEERRSLSSIIENILNSHIKNKAGTKCSLTERRRYLRKDVSLPAFVYQSDARESTLQTGTVSDISLGGLRLSIPQGYDVQQEAEFDTIFTVPNEKVPVKMRCTIKRIINDGETTKELGAAFINGDFPSYQRLHQYLS